MAPKKQMALSGSERRYAIFSDWRLAQHSITFLLLMALFGSTFGALDYVHTAIKKGNFPPGITYAVGVIIVLLGVTACIASASLTFRLGRARRNGCSERLVTHTTLRKLSLQTIAVIAACALTLEVIGAVVGQPIITVWSTIQVLALGLIVFSRRYFTNKFTKIEGHQQNSQKP